MRSVLFVDPPAFCTSLEGMVAPALRTRPLAVAPPGADRATILALSAEAKLAGLKRGMPVRVAQRLCPDLIVLPPNPRLYARASRALHQILRVYAPAIEPRGYGHAFLDLTGTRRLFGPPEDVAARIRREVSDQLRLAVSVGIATNKLVSQAAIRANRLALAGGRADASAAQHYCSDSLYVPAGDERGFLAPHSLDVMPELNARIRIQLQDYQLDLIGEVAAIPANALCAVFGREGRTLRARAQGIDPRPVLPPERQSEFQVTHTLTTDTNDLGILFPLLRLLTERLGRRLRCRDLTAGRLRIETTYADYSTGSRAVPLKAAVLDAELWDAARRAFVLANTRRLAVRTLSVALDRLSEAEAQLELWSGQRDSGAAGQRGGLLEKEALARCAFAAHLPPRPAALQHAVDHIRNRYGTGAVHGGPLTTHRLPLTHHQTTTTLPNVAFSSITRCASPS
jgi:DNA polymerase IV